MSTFKVDTLQSTTGGVTTLTKQSAAKAWAFYDGTGTASISSSFNISGLVDNGTGDYTLSYTSNMDSATYGGGSSAGSSNNNGQNHQLHIFLAASIRTRAENSSGTLADCARLVFNIHGDLA